MAARPALKRRGTLCNLEVQACNAWRKSRWKGDSESVCGEENRNGSVRIRVIAEGKLEGEPWTLKQQKKHWSSAVRWVTCGQHTLTLTHPHRHTHIRTNPKETGSATAVSLRCHIVSWKCIHRIWTQLKTQSPAGGKREWNFKISRKLVSSLSKHPGGFEILARWFYIWSWASC